MTVCCPVSELVSAWDSHGEACGSAPAAAQSWGSRTEFKSKFHPFTGCVTLNHFVNVSNSVVAHQKRRNKTSIEAQPAWLSG